MVTIIKNQLLKHLSRFTKNLSPEQISLSALRGSGELADLTLDEALLTELLELPTWLRLTSASCNRVSFRIQWTKLKTVPIVLSLDEVRIAVEVCQEPRVPSATGVTAAMPGKYSYIHKVIDGISVNINAVQIHFNCEAFSSSVQLSRVTLESRTPQWARGDLRLTRIKSLDTGQLLIFKELEWQTARVEAQAKGPAAEHLPPLRLLAGSAHCRIVIKKLLSDCSVVGCRLVLQPEPLAWALTDGQLRAALACATALAEPARKATAQATRVKAARKMQAEKSTLSSTSHGPSRGGEHDALARLFAKHDVRETSYHLLAPRIDLHLCDDPGLGRSEKPSLSRGGALQVTLLSMQADFFPYHKASDDRRHWRGYREAATPHTQWLNQSLLSFCSEVVEMFAPRPAPPPPGTDNHVSDCTTNRTPDSEEPRFDAPKPRSGSQSFTLDSDAILTSSRTPNTSHNSSGSSMRTRVLQQLGNLMTSCLVLRIDDFTVYKVSTGAKTRESPRPLVCAERATLPGDAGLLHAELTSFYYPGDVCFPVPPPKMYVQLSPVRVSVDVDTCVWLAAFLPHVARALAPSPAAPAAPALYMDVRMEAIMPKIVLEAGPEHVSQQRDRPRELQICSARASLTNVREPARPEGGLGTRADLSSIISSLRNLEPTSREFPRESGDVDPIHEKFIMHADGVDDVEFDSEACVMWKEARDVWCARAEPLWADLCGARATNGRPTPLLDAVPFTLWACFNEDFSQIWALSRAGGLAGLQLNHYQMLFLLRKLEHMSELAAWLAHDARRQPNSSEGSILLAALVPQVEVTLVLPSSCGGPESSRDLDQDSASVLVDSSSLQDLKLGLETSASCVTSFCAQSSLEVFMSAPLPLPLPSMEEETRVVSPPTPPPTVTFTNNFASFSSMRRGLTSLVTSIDGALARDDSRSDAASTASSDSERYVVVGLAGDTPDDADNAFRDFEHSRVGAGVEVAAEVLERSSSPSERSVTSSCRRRDLVSTSTWRIDNIYAVYQGCGDESSVRMTGAELSSEECSSIPWDEFQSKFAMRARNWNDPSAKTEEDTSGEERTPPQIMARLQRREMPFQGNDVEKVVLCPSEELLRACIRDLRLSVGASTALALAEFAEDELVQPPMPIEILIKNVELHVVEDRPARSISSPPPQHLDVKLSSLCVSRSGEGVVTVGPASCDYPPPVAQAGERGTELAEARERMSRLARENEELRKRLTTLAHVVEDNRELRVLVDEANVLRECAHAAQEETAALLADKRALLDTVRALQEQLSSGCVARGTGKR